MEIEGQEFRARALDPEQGKQQLESNARVGELDVVVSLFGVQDTGKPVGVRSPQIIDSGAFRSVIDDRSRSGRTTPYYLDHGHAHVKGFTDASLKLGKADKFREEDDGLVFRGLFNLQKQLARDMFSDIVFDPDNTPHSFRWDADEVYAGTDGVEHVKSFNDILEVSYVGRGAQMGTGVVPGTMSMRASMDDIKKWMREDTEFAGVVREVLGIKEAPPAAPEPVAARGWLDTLTEAEAKESLERELKSDTDARALLRSIIEKAEAPEEPDPVTRWMETLWNERATA